MAPYCEEKNSDEEVTENAKHSYEFDKRLLIIKPIAFEERS
jgi:hypothetical protein